MTSCDDSVPCSDEEEDALCTLVYTRVGEGLTTVPSDLAHAAHLTHVNLHGNAISRLTRLHRLGHLRDLNLSSNNLTALGTGLCQCVQLRVLNLSSNQLQVGFHTPYNHRCIYTKHHVRRTCTASRA